MLGTMRESQSGPDWEKRKEKVVSECIREASAVVKGRLSTSNGSGESENA